MIGILRVVIIILALGIAGFGFIAIMFDGDMNKFKSKIGLAKQYANKTSAKTNTNKKAKNTKENNKKTANSNKDTIYLKDSQDFLDFESIAEVNPANPVGLIIRKNSTEFVGILEVYGINYNLLSIEEREILEDSFSKLLNGIDYPIQITIQSRKIEIENYKKIYTERLEEIGKIIKKFQDKIDFLNGQPNVNTGEVNDLIDRKNKLETQLQYGYKLNAYIEERCKDKNMLDRKYFISVTHKHNPNKFNEELTDNELLSNAYFDISNKLNSIVGALQRAKLDGKILSAIEIAECLYVSYNKGDSEYYSLKNALKSNFSHYYTTAEPVEVKAIKRKIAELEEFERQLGNGVNPEHEMKKEETA